jgi:hypothetical protein
LVSCTISEMSQKDIVNLKNTQSETNSQGSALGKIISSDLLNLKHLEHYSIKNAKSFMTLAESDYHPIVL